MDPNATYEILRYSVSALIEALQEREDYASDDIHDEYIIESADTVAEAFDALDGWLRNGGFLPREWTKNR